VHEFKRKKDLRKMTNMLYYAFITTLDFNFNFLIIPLRIFISDIFTYMI
jgi:hypothetical protein